MLSFKYFIESNNPRIPRKKGQPANSKKHSDLYTDENPKGTIKGLGFKDVKMLRQVNKIKNLAIIAIKLQQLQWNKEQELWARHPAQCIVHLLIK